MRYMMIVKAAENQGFPPKELMTAMGAMSEEVRKAGAMISDGGLLPTAQGARVEIRGGKLTTTDGPFTEAKEVVGGFAIFELNFMKDAIESAEKFMELHRKYWPAWEGVTEIRPMFAPGHTPPCE
jgi:hypothetical protein